MIKGLVACDTKMNSLNFCVVYENIATSFPMLDYAMWETSSLSSNSHTLPSCELYEMTKEIGAERTKKNRHFPPKHTLYAKLIVDHSHGKATARLIPSSSSGKSCYSGNSTATSSLA